MNKGISEADGGLPMAGELAETPAAPVKPEPDENTTALISELTKKVKAPEPVQTQLDTLEASRQYLHTDAMLLDEEDAVGTNFALRFQYAMLAVVLPSDPRPRVRPTRWLPPDETMGAPITYPHELVAYAQTHEIILEAQQRQCALEEIVSGAVQDAFTTPLALVKMRWQEDFTKDALGYARFNDQQDAIAEFQYLKKLETRSPADERRLVDVAPIAAAAEIAVLEDDLARNPPPPPPMMMDPMTGQMVALQTAPDPRVERINALRAGQVDPDLPEVAVYRGWVAQQIRPEDFRWDWQITRPEDLRYARWMAHRVWMRQEDVGRKWNLTPDETRDYAGYDGAGRILQATGDAGMGASGLGGADSNEADGDTRETYFAVWEFWDRIAGKVYTFCEGARDFLRVDIAPATGSRFFPFFALGFNRVTGRVMGPSDTDFAQPLHDEINTLRTHEREARKSSYPRFVAAKGLLDPGEKVKLEQALPFSVTELNKAEEVAKGIMPIIPVAFNPAAYDTSKALLDLQTMMGMPLAATGVAGGARLATEAAIAREGMNAQSDQRGAAVRRMYRDIYEYMAQVNSMVLNATEAVGIAGPGAVWPTLDRQQILAGFTLEVEAGNGMQDRKQQLDEWMTIAGIAGQMGLPLNPVEVLKEILGIMGKRMDLSRFVLDPATMAAMQAAGMGQQGGGGANQPSRKKPDDQGGRGKEGGNPGMRRPPTPENVPGGPLAGG